MSSKAKRRALRRAKEKKAFLRERINRLGNDAQERFGQALIEAKNARQIGDLERQVEAYEFRLPFKFRYRKVA